MDSVRYEFEGYRILIKVLKSISAKLVRFAGFFNRQAEKIAYLQYMLLFGEKEDDIYIVTYPKSGTTLMQMLLYCLTTEGKMDFDHIYDVSPWIRNEAHRKVKPKQLPSPRIIKCHDRYQQFNKKTKGRFIFIYRDGMDVAVSHFHQNKNYNNPDLTFDGYLNSFFKTAGWFKFCKHWFQNKNKLPVLYLRYEDLLQNKKNEIERVISFLNINPSSEQIDRAIQQSSFEFMKKNEDKFGEPKPPEKIYDNFIRKGQIGEGRAAFDEVQRLKFEEYYQKQLKDLERQIFMQ